MQTVLVTGSAGFIGYHVCARLLSEGLRVVGLDAMTDYYDVNLKRARLAQLEQHDAFTQVTSRVEAPGLVAALFAEHRPDFVIHLAAQAGVRHSIEAPRDYLESNIVGTFEILEAARAHPPRHLLLASTSSVFGANTEMPYRETDRADHQMSFYSASKKSVEAMAHSYAHLFDIPTTLFRFFTVYGPWGRPDMAPYKFTRAVLAGEPIDVYNHGKMQRDFTYVDDLVAGIRLLMDAVPVRPEGAVAAGDSLSPVAPWRVVNVGNSEPVELMDFIAAIEAATGKAAICNFMEMQPGDVPATWADGTLLQSLTGYRPGTSVPDGVAAFVDWYRDYYGVGGAQ